MPVQNVSMTSPMDVDAQAIAKRRAMAEALQQQSLSPVEAPSYQGIQAPVSWTQGLAKMLQAYGSRKSMDKADIDQKALIGRQQERRGADMSAMVRALQGTPASSESIVDEQANDGMGQVAQINAPAVSPMQGLQAAIPQMQDPQMQNLAMQQYMTQMQREQAPPTYQDLGDRVGVIKNGSLVGYLPKGASPDVMLKEGGLDRRHLTPSGSAVLSEQGQNQRHLTPSGSAQLGARTTLQTHQTPSGSAILGAETQRRAQDQAVDPAVQGRLADARAAGQATGEARANSQITLPQAEHKMNQAVSLINQMIGTSGKQLKPGEKETAPHPGFKGTVGFGYGMRFVPGTSEADFQAMLDQVRGGAFLQAFESLKGGGAITQIEGQKAEQAITRMREAQSEGEFVRAAREFEDNITKGMSLARQKAGASQQQPIVVDW